MPQCHSCYLVSPLFSRIYTYEPPFLDKQAGKQESHLIHMHNYVEQMKIHVTLWRGTCVLLPHQTHNKKNLLFRIHRQIPHLNYANNI